MRNIDPQCFINYNTTNKTWIFSHYHFDSGYGIIAKIALLVVLKLDGLKDLNGTVSKSERFKYDRPIRTWLIELLFSTKISVISDNFGKNSHQNGRYLIDDLVDNYRGILQARQYWAMSNGWTDRRQFIWVIFCKTVFRISIEYPINLPHGTRILKHGRIRQRLH